MFNRDKKTHPKEPFGLKQKAITVALLVVMSIALVVLPSVNVLGQPPTGFAILQITKQGTISPTLTEGYVDEPITVVATQLTSNGPYLMYFGNFLVGNSTSQGYLISSNFTIPQLPGGNYNISLIDVNQNQGTTSPFGVAINYIAQPIVPPEPAQLQEGNSVSLNVSVTGGQPNNAYSGNIVVMMPVPLSSNYSSAISFNSSSLGTANTVLNFPGTSFQPSGSTTIYAGQYNVILTIGQNVTQYQFSVGLTDQTGYHRGDTVKLFATGYQASQTATLTITSPNGSSVFSQSVTADGGGTMNASWLVPTSVVLGQYNATITPQANAKAVPDTQLFSILGLPVLFRALNLAGEPVPNLAIEALDQASNAIYNGTTGSAGIASISIADGNYTVSAYWNDVNVAETQILVSGNSTYDIQCSLTDLVVSVQDKNGATIPFVNLNFSYQYTTRTGAVQPNVLSAQTNILGVYVVNSTLPRINYVIDASKYNVVFNVGNNTASNLPAQPIFKAVIICPDETLSLKTLDYSLAALPNVRIELVEQASGIFYSANTDNAGAATTQVTFGQYKLQVFTANNILLNETIVNVLSNTQAQIVCSLYNLQVTVKVVDYFGNPISNANVDLSRSGLSKQSATTQGDGTATFNNVIGGSVEITAYPSGNPNSFVAENVQITAPTTVQITMGKFALVGPFLMETTLMVALLVILVAVVLFLVIELYRWRGSRLKRIAEVKMNNKEP